MAKFRVDTYRSLIEKIMHLLLTVLMILSINSCVTTFRSEPAELERFDRAIKVPDSELNCLYDIKQLRVGSMALFRQRYESKLILVSYRLIAHDNTTQKYTLEMSTIGGEGNGLVTTFEVDSSGFRRLLLSSNQMKLINQMNLDTDLLEPTDREALGNIFVGLTTGGTVGGGLSVILEIIKKNRSKVVYDRGVQAIKEHGHETGMKIVKVTHVLNEEVIIGNRRLLCRVYQIDTISKGIAVSSGQPESWYVVTDKSEKIWVSDDIPFGVVKRESRRSGLELIDFKY